MTGARIIVDGLWRCLCPSIDTLTLNRALAVPQRPRRRTTTTPCARAGPRRRLHTTNRRCQDVESKKEEGLYVVESDAEAKSGEHDKELVSQTAESGGKLPIIAVDQGATEAWRGYFDVVFAAGMKKRRPHLKTGNDPLHDVFAPEEDELKDGAPTSRHFGQGSSSTAAIEDAGAKALDAIFGADKGKAQDSKTPKVDFSGEESPPIHESVDAGTDPFDEIVNANAGKQSGARSNDAHKPQPRWTPNTVIHGPAALSEAEALGNEASPGPPFSTASGPTGEGTAQAVQATNLLEPPSPRQERPGSKRKDPNLSEDMFRRLVNLKAPYKDVPPEAGNEEIRAAISESRMKGSLKHRKITATLVKHLLDRPGSKPNAFIYDTLFRAHSLPQGSAEVVNFLLKEMRENRVHWSSAAYHSVLRVLAVHPDYLLRNDMIREMRERWIDIYPKGHRYIAIGLLRDEQYELALDKLEWMIQEGIEIDSWVFDVFTYVFGKLEFLDDALRITRHRVDRGFEVPVNMWYYLLDVFSKAQHYGGTTYIWNRTVQQGIVNPSDGACLSILNMASVYGDTELATQVIQYLAERGTRLARPHYEALADAYSMQGNVERAIEVYCIMYGAGAEVNQTSAGTLCQVLTREPRLIDKAVEAMTHLKQTYKIPVGVYNAVLSEMVKSSALSANDAFVKGLDLYRRIRDFVPRGPNWETFRNILRRCTRPDVAQFLAGEMIACGIRQPLAVTELMFKVHVENNGPIHRTKNYFFKVSPHLHNSYPPGSRRWQNIMDLAVRLVKRLIAEQDPEAWRILEICRRNGLEEDKIDKLREEVEAGRLTVAPNLDTAEKPGLKYPEITDVML